MKHLRITILFLSWIFAGVLTACGGGTSGIKAKDVNDEQSLKAFVHSARDHLLDDYEQAIVDFKKDPRWVTDRDVHLFIVDEAAVIHLHNKIPIVENQRTGFTDLDTGEIIGEKLLDVGLSGGGGFARYRLEGYESERVAYVLPFRRDVDQRDYIICGSFSLK